MNRAVIDTSVFLALYKKEPVLATASFAMMGGYMSTVNVAEIYTKLAKWGVPESAELRTLLGFLQQVVPLTLRQAAIAGEMLPKTAAHGLSLGDRCCLALAIDLGAEVYTCERQWANVNVGCKVHLMR